MRDTRPDYPPEFDDEDAFDRLERLRDAVIEIRDAWSKGFTGRAVMRLDEVAEAIEVERRIESE